MSSIPVIVGAGASTGPGMGSRRPRRRYAIYGVHVESDIRLPTAPLTDHDDIAPAIVFRHGEPRLSAPEPDGPIVGEFCCEHGNRMCVRYLGPGGDWIQFSGIGTFHVAVGARHVDVYPAATMSERSLGLVLVGHIAVFVLYLLGCPSLHAGAVATERGAVVFLGPKGQGKSTLTASFLRRGAALLTDDALPLRQEADGIYGAPSLPMMKLWRETAACALQLPEELPNLVSNYEKKLFELDDRFVFAEGPRRLRAIYVLDRYDEDLADHRGISIRTLSPRESFAALMPQTAYLALLRPIEAVGLLPLYSRLVAQAPVRVLSFPSGFERQEVVYERIMADLEAS